MKILHTADWHLGKKLYDKNLEREQGKFLDWLLQTISEQGVDLLIVAGDIFDMGNPPNEARKQYYSFLTSLKQTPCKNIIIVGGNHDSPSQLDAPQGILELLNIYVLGGTTDNIEDEIIEIKDENQQVNAIVCAVPFLRDKDVHYSRHSENQEEREQRVKTAIQEHYQSLIEIVQSRNYLPEIPIIATGHLFAQGASLSDSELDIYVGNLGRISAEEFPKEFDYIALGHLHCPQEVGNSAHIRYSGSPVPLSFSEIHHQKQVLQIEFFGTKEPEITALSVPVFRKLLSWRGNVDEIKQKIEDFQNESEEIWLELKVELDKRYPNLDTELRNFAKEQGKNLSILKINIEGEFKEKMLSEMAETLNLSSLDQEQVFQMLCHSQNKSPEETQQLTQTFTELQQLIDNNLIQY